jgi:hypothetical protein
MFDLKSNTLQKLFFSFIQKKGKQATKGDAQIGKENAETIEFYKKILTIVNVRFIFCYGIKIFLFI